MKGKVYACSCVCVLGIKDEEVVRRAWFLPEKSRSTCSLDYYTSIIFFFTQKVKCFLLFFYYFTQIKRTGCYSPVLCFMSISNHSDISLRTTRSSYFFACLSWHWKSHTIHIFSSRSLYAGNIHLGSL